MPPVGIFFGLGIGSPLLGMTVPLEQQVSQQLLRWKQAQMRSFRLGLQQLSQVLQHLGAGQQVGLQQVGLQQVGLQHVGLQHVVGQAGLQQTGAQVSQQLLRWKRRPQQSLAGLQQVGAGAQQRG